jgi:GGDEF domain-containing protein
LDQTAADSDQTASDTDQSMSDRDQAASEADQRVSDRDQVAADRDLEAHPSSDPARLLAHEQAQAGRGEATMARMATNAVRAQIASERHEQALHRDQVARRRDEVAAVRDREADEADEAAERLAGQLGKDNPAAKVATVARAAAAGARASAARDRERAAADREAAARDRELLIGEIENSHMDELTGAYGRRIGEVLLRYEVERAKRMKKMLAVGVVGLDGIAENNARGVSQTHLVVLRDSFLALQARLRPYDPIVRWGENELIFAIAEMAPEDARVRLDGARSDILSRNSQAPIATGLAMLEDDDTLGTLIARVEAAATE